MQPVKIILSGCSGKMGRAITELAQTRQDISITAGIDKFPSSCGYPVFADFKDINITGDVIIDFSRPDMLPSLLEYALKHNTPAVLATTGYSNEALNQIKLASGSIPIFMSGNMSLGVNLMLSLLKTATKILKNTFDIEIIEKHHNQKVDAPSGTALMMAQAINDAAGGDMQYIYDRHVLSQKRQKDEIGIHSVRGGTIVGEHTVIFAGTDECLEITHSAQSRGIFAAGALSAAKFLCGKTPGSYNMDDLIAESENT